MAPTPRPDPGGRDVTGIPDGLSRFLSDRRRVVLSLAVGLFLAVGVVLLLGKASGLTEFADRLKQAHAGWLVAGVAVQVLSILAYVTAFRTITTRHSGHPLPIGPTSQIVLAGLGATRLLAAAGAGGLAVNYWGLRRAGIGTRESIARVLMLNTLLYIVFGVTGMVTAAIMWARGTAPAGLAIPWIATIGGCLIAAGVVSSRRYAGRLSHDPTGARTGRPRLATAVRSGFATAVVALVRTRAVLHTPLRHAPLLIGCVGYWVTDIACLAIGLRAFDVHVGIGTIVLGYVTGYVANLLPLPTGGVGGIDAAMTFALHLLGVPLEDALAGVVAYRFVGFWLPTIPGIWALVRLPRLGRRLGSEATDPG
jgi:putative heme transporter